MADIRSPEFWTLEKQILWDELHNLIMDTMLQGMSSAVPLLPAAIRPLIDFELANQFAIDFLQDYRINIVDGITDTTRNQTIRAFNTWITSGEHIDRLAERLAPTFGSARARRIAVTEVTRVYAAGNMAMWQSTGVVGGKKWQTVRDERVCPICGPLHQTTVAIDSPFTLSPQQVADSPQMRALLGDNYNPMNALVNAGRALRTFGGAQPHPPAHVSCRCWILPFVGLPLLEEAIGRELALDFFKKVKTDQYLRLIVDVGDMSWQK